MRTLHILILESNLSHLERVSPSLTAQMRDVRMVLTKIQFVLVPRLETKRVRIADRASRPQRRTFVPLALAGAPELGSVGSSGALSPSRSYLEYARLIVFSHALVRLVRSIPYAL